MAGFRVVTSYPLPGAIHSTPQYMVQRGHESYDVWEVCAATTASPEFFLPVKIKPELSPGEYYCPSNEWDEPNHFVEPAFKQLWPGENGLVVSIGTGSVPRHFTRNIGMNADMWFGFYRDLNVNAAPKDDCTKFNQIKDLATADLANQDVAHRFRHYVAALRHSFGS